MPRTRLFQEKRHRCCYQGVFDQTYSRSQFVTLNRGRGQNIKYKPCAFTEHGIIMLASVLRSHEATQVSLRIVRAFVAMRKFILANAQVFQRIESVEQRQIATEGKVNEILNRLNVDDVPLQGVFYNGQFWDARALEKCCQCENVANCQFQFPIEEAA